MMATVDLIDARSAAERVLQLQQCGKPKCPCAIAVRRGSGLTHCPLHNDPSPSFNVSVKADKLLVCCQANCDQKAVVQQMKDNDLWPERAEYGKQIVAEYDYRDKDGVLLYQAVREFPKNFKQRRPDGSGGWVWKLEDVQRVPYRLPDLLSDTKRRVFVVEGEKDVDRLYALGLSATCNVGGAGKWRDEYSEYLRGRHVCLIPDRDEAGRQHMRSVSDSLKRVGATVTWLELPGDDKDDVSDWLDDGHSVAELKELALSAGPVPEPPKRERVFRREGLSFRVEPTQAPIVAWFSNIADSKDKTSAELRITRQDGQFVLRRAVNLLAASGTTFNGIIEDLKEESLGIDVDWKRVLRDEFEAVLDAHRNGLVLEAIGGNIQTPRQVEWFCDDLLLKNKMNCWLASAGTGKSTLAKALATCYAAEQPFLGRCMGEPGEVLYLDWEDDKDDFERIAYQICKGMNIWPVPLLNWLSMRGRRMRDHVDKLGRIIAEKNVKLIVIDAIAAAGGSPGEHLSWEAIALELEQCLGQLPPVTVLGLDHVTSAEHKDGKANVPLKARGSERKVEFYRNQWTLMLDRGELSTGRHVVTWYHTKINTGVPRPEFTTELIHGQNSLVVCEGTTDASPEAVGRLPLYQQYVVAVRRSPGLKTEDICLEVRETTERTKVIATRVQLQKQERRGEVWCQDDRWYPAGHPGPENYLPASLPYRDA
jgi:hypothetical protein